MLKKRNKVITHKSERVKTHVEGNIYSYEERYLCNWAVSITPKKMKRNWKDVTCKNCLKKKYKGE